MTRGPSLPWPFIASSVLRIALLAVVAGAAGAALCVAVSALPGLSPGDYALVLIAAGCGAATALLALLLLGRHALLSYRNDPRRAHLTATRQWQLLLGLFLIYVLFFL